MFDLFARARRRFPERNRQRADAVSHHRIVDVLLAFLVLSPLLAASSSLAYLAPDTPRLPPPRRFVRSVELESYAVGPSPYICGANLDPHLAASLTLAKQLGVTTVRFPDDANYTANLSAVKSAGLQPLIILHGSGIPDPSRRLTADQQLIEEARQVFGSQTRVFYEIGNENDLQSGLSASDYTAMWNALVPQLKQIAPDSWFGGPVNYQANPPYVASFVHAATPKPDFVSWHEYTCPSSANGAYCIAHIGNWSRHVVNIRAAIQANLDAVPPLMVTEWNYAPDAGVATDDKHADANFMTPWTTTALETLIANNIYASDQFDVSNATPLLDRPQGRAFQTICQSMASSRRELISLAPRMALPLLR